KRSQVGAVLSRDPGDQCALHEHSTVGKDTSSNNRGLRYARQSRAAPPLPPSGGLHPDRPTRAGASQREKVHRILWNCPPQSACRVVFAAPRPCECPRET